jgi:voltage-gated potassium channel Kch
VLVIGAGKVGQAAARALKRKGSRVHAVDRTDLALAPLVGEIDNVFVGDAADRRVLERAGILEARSVLLTTNDDAMNVLSVVALQHANELMTPITSETILPADAELVMLGSDDQRPHSPKRSAKGRDQRIVRDQRRHLRRWIATPKSDRRCITPT